MLLKVKGGLVILWHYGPEQPRTLMSIFAVFFSVLDHSGDSLGSGGNRGWTMGLKFGVGRE